LRKNGEFCFLNIYFSNQEKTTMKERELKASAETPLAKIPLQIFF
jgi:hypothetical protein